MRLIKEIDEVKIKHYAKMERTGKITQYRKWYNILPVFLFKKQLIKLSEEISNLISDNKLDKIDKIEWKARSLAKINILESAYNIAILHLQNGVEMDKLISKVKKTRRIRRTIEKKIKYNHDNLKIAIQIIELISGIKINDDGSNLEGLRKEIVRLKDKFNENFKEQETKGETISIMESAGTYFAYMNQEFSNIPETTITSLIELKRQAEKKHKEHQEFLDKQKNK